MTATVKADSVTFYFQPGNQDGASYLSTSGAGLWTYLSLMATDAGTGVDFTFTSDWTYGSNNGGRGSVQGQGQNGYFYVYNAADVFTTSPGVTAGGYLNSLDNTQGTGFTGQTLASFQVTTAGNYTLVDDVWQITFSMAYADGMGWDDFYALVSAEADPFTVGAHLAGLGNGSSSGAYLTAGTVPGGGTVPEPATLALVGLGLAGLGLARRRK